MSEYKIYGKNLTSLLAEKTFDTREGRDAYLTAYHHARSGSGNLNHELNKENPYPELEYNEGYDKGILDEKKFNLKMLVLEG